MAGQDYKRTIAPGGAERINANGESFLFCKFSDRDVTVDIGGAKVVMRSGSYQEFQPLSGHNANVTIYNEDTENPASVIFVMGTGTYDEKIVRGEISIEPILRNADGTVKPDTRHDVRVDLVPQNLVLDNYNAGDLIATGQTLAGSTFSTASNFIFQTLAGDLVFMDGGNNGSWRVSRLGLQTLEYDPDFNGDLPGTATATDMAEHPTLGFVALRTSTNELYQWTGSAWELKGELPAAQTVNSLCYMPDRKAWAATTTIAGVDGAGVYLFSDDLASQTAFIAGNISSSHVARYDRANAQLYLVRNINYIPVDIGAGTLGAEVAITYEGNQNNGVQYGRAVVHGDDVFFMEDVSETRVRKHAFKDYTTKPEFRAIRPGCDITQAMVKPDQLPQITASITATGQSNGVKVTGEVIRAAIEYYFRRAVPDGYLDHVYAVDFTRDGSSRPFAPIVTGNQTFARANVADEFNTLLPGQVVITIDNELTLGDFL